jgi:hypothetical protein
MTDWKKDITDALADFCKVAALAGIHVELAQFDIEFLDAPHRPPRSLPAGKMAIYGFWNSGQWLKVGMVGPNSQARYVSQHYNAGSALSTLAGSLAHDQRMAEVEGFDATAPGAWIKSSCNRVNILLSATLGRELLALLEAFLHVRFNPCYER